MNKDTGQGAIMAGRQRLKLRQNDDVQQYLGIEYCLSLIPGSFQRSAFDMLHHELIHSPNSLEL